MFWFSSNNFFKVTFFKRLIILLFYYLIILNYFIIYLIGRVVSPQSFGIPLSDGSMPIDILKESEKYYLEVIKLVSGVSKQGIDSYFSYYSILKLAELRVLQAIAINYPNNSNENKNISHINDIITKSDRDYYFESALKYLLDALQAKKPFENTDLHFLCSSQMGYLLSIDCNCLTKRERKIRHDKQNILLTKQCTLNSFLGPIDKR